MSRLPRTLLTGLLLFSASRLIAQEAVRESSCDPDQTLSHAESEFHAGHFYSIPAIINKCKESSRFSTAQDLRAYELLCQVYLIIDDPIAAEDSYLKLLQADPEFIPNEREDPIDLVYLSKKFTATPIFTPHLRVGPNATLFRSIYNVSTEPYPVNVDRSLGIGIQVGGGVDWNLDDNFSLCIEADFVTRSYSRIANDVSGDDEATVNAHQNWVDVPLYFKYSKAVGNLRPFGYIGYAANFLFSANNDFTYTTNKPDGSQQISSGPSESVSYQRKLVNRSWLVGGGIKYKVGKDFLYVDLRYMGGVTNLASTDEIYYSDPSKVENSQIGDPNFYMSSYITKYRYISDYFRLDNISLSFGFIRPIYDPRKLRKAKTKGVLRMLRKEEGEKKK